MTRTLAIVGGGLAGISAAVDAVERGWHVEVFEAAPRLGGRAGSLLDATRGERIDRSQHVAMGCCRMFLDFCRRTGIEGEFERSSTYHFIAPDGGQHDFTPSRWLPVPLHLLPGLMRLRFLSLGERWSIVRTMAKLAGSARSPHPSPLPTGEGTIGDWLRQQRQSERAIELFWSVVLVSALGETVDVASLTAARQVFRDGFFASRDACQLFTARTPLGDVLHDRVGAWLARRGVAIHLATSIRQIETRPDGGMSLVSANGARREFDAAIVAVPWRDVRELFAKRELDAMPSLAYVDRICPAEITAVHLWFDRPITTLPHAVLIGRRSQWVFARQCDSQGTQYLQVVISASHRMPRLAHDALLGEVRGELEGIWPAAHDARLLGHRVIVQPSAVFSMTPEVDGFRPTQQTPIPNIALAGDWTATGWPATMEGAVRSGQAAVKALAS